MYSENQNLQNVYIRINLPTIIFESNLYGRLFLPISRLLSHNRADKSEPFVMASFLMISSMNFEACDSCINITVSSTYAQEGKQRREVGDAYYQPKSMRSRGRIPK